MLYNSGLSRGEFITFCLIFVLPCALFFVVMVLSAVR